VTYIFEPSLAFITPKIKANDEYLEDLLLLNKLSSSENRELLRKQIICSLPLISYLSGFIESRQSAHKKKKACQTKLISL